MRSIQSIRHSRARSGWARETAPSPEPSPARLQLGGPSKSLRAEFKSLRVSERSLKVSEPGAMTASGFTAPAEGILQSSGRALSLGRRHSAVDDETRTGRRRLRVPPPASCGRAALGARCGAESLRGAVSESAGRLVGTAAAGSGVTARSSQATALLCCVASGGVRTGDRRLSVYAGRCCRLHCDTSPANGSFSLKLSFFEA